MAIIKRALISCHDKTGLETLAKGLAQLGVELVASKGTAMFLEQHGLKVRTVEAFAGITEQLDGQVKTLHPRIHAGILARRDDPAHVASVGPDGLIDAVIVTLYPFQEVSRKPGVTMQEALEHVDIGGVALLRAAAKNFPAVLVLSDPQQYAEALSALQRGKGQAPEELRRRFATTAFELTSRYDQCIAAFFANGSPMPAAQTLNVSARPHQPLRYGENPHQPAAWYVADASVGAGLAQLRQLHGKELSYNNLLDIDTLMRCVRDFSEPTCVIVKHASPCGVASAATAAEAYQRALAGDPESAFGGIVGINRPLDTATATAMASLFLEVIVAPAIGAEAQAAFAKKPNVRLVSLAPSASTPANDWHSILGGWLIQEQDVKIDDPAARRVATTRKPSDEEQRDLTFAWLVAKHVKSNAIVIAKQQATVGIGQGQPSRVRAVHLAIQNAGAKSRGACLASDGFFPFPDSVDLLAQAGITAVIQPGGSVKDPDVIAAANRAGLAMIMTGMRHFRH